MTDQYIRKGETLTYAELFARFAHTDTLAKGTAREYTVNRFKKKLLEIKFLHKKPVEIWFVDIPKLYNTYYSIAEPESSYFSDRELSTSPLAITLLLDIGVINKKRSKRISMF